MAKFSKRRALSDVGNMPKVILMNNNYNDDYENEEYSGEEYDGYPDEEYNNYSDENHSEYEEYYEHTDEEHNEYNEYFEETTVKYVEPEFISRDSFVLNNDSSEFVNENFEYENYYEDNAQTFDVAAEHNSERSESRESRRKSRSSNKKRLAIRFLVVFGSIMLVFVLLLSGVWFGFRPTGDDGQNAVVGFFQRVLGTDDETLIDWNLLPPVKTNVLILGVDDEASLTDTMFLATFDRETLKTDIISLPRDSWITLDDDLFERLNSQWGSRSMRLNAIYNRAVPGEGGEIVKLHVERMLGINIHHWVSMDLVGFRAVVDAMGGVEMEIRPQGFQYFDPVANFRINVPGGRQVLDGVLAEGVVRFRSGYADGDLGRVRMQQEFMTAFMQQLLDREMLRENALSFLGIMISYVNTDFNVVLDLPKYISFIPLISGDSLTFHMLPGVGTTIYPGGVRTAIYQIDTAATRELIDKIFYAPPELPESEDDEPEHLTSRRISIDRANTRIQVLNGAGVSGLAASFGETLSAGGFNIVNVDNYLGSSNRETRIIVRTPGLSYDLEQYFNSTVEEVDESLLGNYDIVIVIGTGDR